LPEHVPALCQLIGMSYMHLKVIVTLLRISQDLLLPVANLGVVPVVHLVWISEVLN